MSKEWHACFFHQAELPFSHRYPETACADIQYDESLYDGSRLRLLLHLTCWHMWASHTASIILYALSINDAPGDARLVAAMVSKLAPIGGRCRRLADKAKTGDVSKQSRQEG